MAFARECAGARRAAGVRGGRLDPVDHRYDLAQSEVVADRLIGSELVGGIVGQRPDQGRIQERTPCSRSATMRSVILL